jgi:hypothetical protein
MLFLIILDIIMIVNSGRLGKIPYPILGKSKEYYVEKVYFHPRKKPNFALLKEMQDAIRNFPSKRKEKTKVEISNI